MLIILNLRHFFSQIDSRKSRPGIFWLRVSPPPPFWIIREFKNREKNKNGLIILPDNFLKNQAGYESLRKPPSADFFFAVAGAKLVTRLQLVVG